MTLGVCGVAAVATVGQSRASRVLDSGLLMLAADVAAQLAGGRDAPRRLAAAALAAAAAMHSFWQRLNAIFFYTLSVLGFLASSRRARRTGTRRTQDRAAARADRAPQSRRGHDQAILTLGIDADLRSVWNWNVKQLFVYVTAEYETEANVLNQVVVWDTIVNDVSQAWIRSDAVVNKYSLTDQGYGLRDNNVTLVLNWNTVPSTGLLTLHHGWSSTHTFTVPDAYS